MITYEDILQTRQRIAPYVNRTPVEYAHLLSEQVGTGIHLKLEHLQVSGSFKPRGGFNKILKTLEQQPKAHFVAPTAGGHGVGLSYAASRLGVETDILMPASADPDRIRAISRNGANIQTFPTMKEARLMASQLANKKGYIPVSAYNDAAMIEGGGTMALELLESLPNIDTLVCGVGGGGYLAGMGIVLKTIKPGLKIYGVQQENAAFLADWFRAGRYPDTFKFRPSLAEGIGGMVEADALTWPYIREFLKDFIIVNEKDLAETVRWMLKEHKYYTEPSGITGLAGIRKKPDLFKGRRCVATVITGRNMGYEKLRSIMNRD